MPHRPRCTSLPLRAWWRKQGSRLPLGSRSARAGSSPLMAGTPLGPDIWPSGRSVHGEKNGRPRCRSHSITRPPWLGERGTQEEAVLGEGGAVWSAGPSLFEPGGCWLPEADPKSQSPSGWRNPPAFEIEMREHPGPDFSGTEIRGQTEKTESPFSVHPQPHTFAPKRYSAHRCLYSFL